MALWCYEELQKRRKPKLGECSVMKELTIRELTLKELALYTLEGDIIECLRGGMTRLGVSNFLKRRYLNKGISSEEFDTTLDELCNNFKKPKNQMD